MPPSVGSKAAEAIQVAESCGLVLDEFQRIALDGACGVREDGKWSAFEVGVDVARQNGKGGIIEARELGGIFAWGERLILHSAHEFQTATEAMLRMEDLLLGDASMAQHVKSVSRSHGSEGFIFKSGQRLRYRTRTKGGGRGFTAEDTLILDEAMVLAEAFIGALLPTLSARSVHGNPQVWYLGSPVDLTVHDNGVVFARLRERGVRGGDPSLAWFEWSGFPPADGDGNPVTPGMLSREDLADREAWARANPGLGIRISEEHIEKELRSMDPRTFAVERLGVGDWPATDQDASVIDVVEWEDLVDHDSVIDGPVCFAVDMAPDRSFASIVAAGRRSDRRFHVEVVEHRRGTRWVAPRLVDLLERHENRGVVFDSASPAASLVHELEESGIEATSVTAREHSQACGQLLDLIERAELRHLGQPELASAIRGAAQRPLGDAWAWSRKTSSVDISPLVGVTLALWSATSMPEPEPATPRFIDLASV